MSEAPHPRLATRVIGHADARAAFSTALASGRMPHAWLLTGPEGIGKATFAYVAAKGLLSGDPLGPEFTIDAGAPSAATVAAGSHPDLLTLDRDDRDAKRKKPEISVDEARRAPAFLSKTATLGGRRVIIVDGADSMNRNAANAILKTLEEPPAGVALFLVAHQAGRLPDTIFSRCRRISFRPPPIEDAGDILRSVAPSASEADREEALALADGRPGEAARILAEGGIALYRRVGGLVGQAASLDLRAAHTLAEALGRNGAEDEFARFDRCLTGLVRASARRAAAPDLGPPLDRDDPVARLAAASPAERLVGALDGLSEVFSRAYGANMDRRQTTLEALLLLRDAVRAK